MDTLMLFYNIHCCIILYKAYNFYIMHKYTFYRQLIVENPNIMNENTSKYASLQKTLIMKTRAWSYLNNTHFKTIILLLVKTYWLSTGKCIHTLKKIIRQKRMFPHHKCMFEFVSFMYGYRCMRMHDVRFFIKTFELCLSKMVFLYCKWKIPNWFL